MNSIADLVAKHRDYCAEFKKDRVLMYRGKTGEYVTIEEYKRRVSKHLAMTVNKIKHLNQRGYIK